MTLPMHLALTPVLAAKFGDFLPLLAILFVVISALRAYLQSQRAQQQHKVETEETDDERRAREIRERLRRIMAERRGEAPPVPLPSSGPAEPPPLVTAPPKPARVPPIDPFGGSMRRILDELTRPEPVRRAPPPPPPEPPPRPVAVPLSPEPARAVTLGTFDGEGPHAPLLKSARAIDPQVAARRAEARQRLLGDLRDPEALRRAFVLREILGPPVSLRGQR